MKSKITKSRAAILVSQNMPLEIDTINLPEKLEFGQVLIKVEVSGICGSQIGEIDGHKGPDKFLPHLLGHEGCGRVIQIGEGVKTVKEDDKVVLHWKVGEGIQSNTPKYFWRGKVLNAGWITTFNDYAIISENRCTKIPSHTDSTVASLMGCAITTGFGVIENNAKLKMGESVVIFGSGGLGLSMIQAAKSVSAWPIIAVDIHQNRLNLAKDIGATHIINSRDEDAFDKLNKIFKDSPLDVFIDNTGIPSIIEKGYKLTKKDGKIILVGVPKLGQNINIYSLSMHFGKQIIGSFGGSCKPEIDIPRYLNHVDKNKIDMNRIISKTFEIQDINEAIKAMRDGSTAGRVLINF